MAQFFVHFGAHKTGTTAFQAWLQHNRTALYESGLIVPQLKINAFGNYKILVKALTEQFTPAQMLSFGHSLVRYFEEEIKQSPNHDIFISSEYLSSYEFRGHIKRLAKWIENHGYEKIAILVVRDQCAWVNSRYSQRRKLLCENPMRPVDEYIDELIKKQNGNWMQLSDELIQAGFKVRVFPYTQSFKKNGVVKEIMSIPELSQTATANNLSDGARINENLGSMGLIAADETAKLAYSIRPKLSGLTRIKLSTLIINRANRRFKDMDIPFNAMTPNRINRIEQAYASSNVQFSNTHFSKTWQQIFPPFNKQKLLSPMSIDELNNRDQKTVRSIAEAVIERGLELKIL